MSLERIAMLLVLVGALNWGLVGALNLNVVEKATGNRAQYTKLVYIIVGLAAAFVAFKKLTAKSL
jgi:uncharacterized membrane protein YuzA (DUF378 family)